MTESEIFTLAGASKCDPRTVKAYIAGESVRGATAIAIETAARALRIELPERKGTRS